MNCRTKSIVSTAVRARCMRAFPWACSVLLLFACVTEKDPAVREDLDVAKVEVSNTEGQPNSSTPQSSDPAQAAFDWKVFFKGPVTREDRQHIEKKLSIWKDEGTVQDYVTKGRHEIAVGRLPSAEANLRIAMRLDSANLDTRLELAQLYLLRKDNRRALEFLAGIKDSMTKAERTDPAFVFRYRYALGLAMLERGQIDKGHQILSDLIAQDPTFVPGYAALASSYLRHGRAQLGEFVAKRALDRTTNDPSILNILGVVAEKKANLDDATNWYNQALALKPQYTQAIINRARVALRKGDLLFAQEELTRALEISPTSTGALIAMSQIKRRSGKATEALDLLSKALTIEPESAAVRFQLASLYRGDLKRPLEAQRLLREVIQTNDQNEEIKSLAKAQLDTLDTDRELERQIAL